MTSFKSKLIIFSLCVTLTPLSIITVIFYHNARGNIRHMILDSLKAITTSRGCDIKSFIETNKIITNNFSSDGFVVNRFKMLVSQGTEKQGITDRLNKYLLTKKMPLYEHLAGIILTDRNGKVISSTNEHLIGRDFSREEVFKQVIEKEYGEACFSQPQYSPDFNMNCMFFAAPIKFGRSGETLGTIINVYSLKPLHGLVDNRVGMFISGEEHLVNKEKMLLTESRFIHDASLKLQMDTEPVRKMLNENREMVGTYQDERGALVVGASLYIPECEWILIAEIDKTEAFSPLKKLRTVALILVAVSIVVVICTGITFAGKVSRPIIDLTEAAKKFAMGNLKYRLKATRRDEIGELAKSFNTMAEKIESEIAERKQTESSLQKSKTSLANAQRIGHLGGWEWNIGTNDLVWSDELYRIFGYTPQSFRATYEVFLNLVHPDDRQFVESSVNEAIYRKKPYSIDHRIVLSDGAVRIVHEEGEVVYDGADNAVQMNGTIQDITERKHIEDEFRKISMGLEQSINIVFFTDIDGNIEYVNPTFERVTGYSKEEVIGQNPRMLASGENPHEKYEELWNTLLAGKTWRGQVKNKKKDGGYYWCTCLNSPIIDSNGRITHFLAIQEDITERKQAEERAEYAASFDILTGLQNRTRFMESMNEWIAAVQTNDNRGALLIVNIDNFRSVNDAYGHTVGDTVLKHIAGTLKNILLDLDRQYSKTGVGGKSITESILGRMGGDEYAIFLPYGNTDEVIKSTEEIKKAIESFWFDDINGYLAVSIGVAVYHDRGVTTRDLFSEADAALYYAKQSGRSNVRLYQQSDLLVEKTRSRMVWKGRIQRAIEDDSFEPWFQPILNLKDATVSHYEALARMRDGHGGTILPMTFIDIAETFGLITALNQVIVEKTLKYQASLINQGKLFSFSMNLSGRDFGDGELLKFLERIIVGTGADAKYLIFEITETAVVNEIDNAVRFIKELKSMGCKFSLDDFGIGFSSFRYLQKMNVDYIKIDGSFIRKLPDSANDRLFVKSIAEVAKGMGIKTVAEFVENGEIVDILKEYGVDYGQGYFIGKPSSNI